MLRREFFRKTALATAGGLILGDAALELFERLTHTPVFTGWSTTVWSAPGEGARLTADMLNKEMKQIFSGPLMSNLVSESELLDLFNTGPRSLFDQPGRYIETRHYFDIPRIS